MHKKLVFVALVILLIGFNSNISAKEPPLAAKKLAIIAKSLSNEHEKLEPIGRQAAKNDNEAITLAVLLLQEKILFVQNILYDLGAFEVLYDRLEIGCKGYAAQIINNRLLIGKGMLSSQKTDLIGWQNYYSNKGFNDLSNAYKKAAEHVSNAVEILDALTELKKIE